MIKLINLKKINLFIFFNIVLFCTVPTAFANDACKGFYAGQLLKLKNRGPFPTIYGPVKYIIIGLDLENGMVTIQHHESKEIVREYSCSALKSELVDD